MIHYIMINKPWHYEECMFGDLFWKYAEQTEVYEEVLAVQNLQAQVENEVREREKAQTDNLTDQQIVDLVENAIRSRPQDFPFLTKYYLNAE